MTDSSQDGQNVFPNEVIVPKPYTRLATYDLCRRACKGFFYGITFAEGHHGR